MITLEILMFLCESEHLCEVLKKLLRYFEFM